MNRPIFGDADTIRHIDPRRVILDDGIAVPRGVLVCRFCEADLFATFDDTWINGDEWGAGMIGLDCTAEPDVDSEHFDEWMDGHEYETQSDQMEDEARVIAWLATVHSGFKNEV